jgi:hypothetical protein
MLVRLSTISRRGAGQAAHCTIPRPSPNSDGRWSRDERQIDAVNLSESAGYRVRVRALARDCERLSGCHVATALPIWRASVISKSSARVR